MIETLKNFCKKLYELLPGVWELRRIETRLNQTLSQHFRDLKVLSSAQTLEIIKANNVRYCDPKRLLSHGAQYWSQNYEDGMIAEIFRRIGTTSKTFLEIGVGDGSENNTTALLVAGWSGWWIEGDTKECQLIAKSLAKMPTLAARLKFRQAFVEPDNIAKLLVELGVPTEVDLFALDIDLNTYHIWAALEKFRPRVVVIEYNAGISPEISWIHPFESQGVWDLTQAQGASLKAYELLGRKKGYSLVGCDITGINAFFVRNDLLGGHFIEPFTAENHYEPPRYFLSCRFGHASKFYGESRNEK